MADRYIWVDYCVSVLDQNTRILLFKFGIWKHHCQVTATYIQRFYVFDFFSYFSFISEIAILQGNL